MGERRLRFPTHGTWLRHLGPLLLLKVRISAISSLPASICAGRRIYAQESLGVCILRGRSVYRSIIYYICISVIRCIRVSRCLDVGTLEVVSRIHVELIIYIIDVRTTPLVEEVKVMRSSSST